ncbi:MAG: hypothetical protein OJJ54_00290 [Pseudonocardia sp.]|nr:hypothetical protein [Pseudonocardia sp.]
MRSDDVREVAQVCTSALSHMLERARDPGTDWAARAGDLDMSVAEVVAHTGQRVLLLATDLAGGPAGLGTVEVRITAHAPPAALVATVRTAAEVLAAVLDATPEDARGFHPDGLSDPSGFAALACDEMLVHTDDAAHGLGVSFVPDPHLAARVLRRLFPWAPRHELSWPTLRWANGRSPLGDRPRQESWRPLCVPLTEWDGARPVP